jgi:hypothetical protein
VLYNQRKAQALTYFAQREWVRPPDYAVASGIYPTKRVYTYLLRLRRWGLLWRGHDVRGRVVYRLSPRGARWLLKRREV